MKVSVIVPVYNGEKYIDNCLRCLTEQTMKEIEVVAVDDCSTDSSRKILEIWKERYPDCIKIIRTKCNMGPGGARNLGIQMATGEYIGFMDCDDQIDVTMYEKLYQVAVTQDCDIVDCAYYEEAIEKSILSYSDEVIGDLNSSKRSTIITGVGYAVTKIFRADILRRSDMRIRENVIYEDLDFLIHATLLAKRVGNVKEVLYVYKNNPKSASKRDREQKKFEDMIAVYYAVDELEQYDQKIKEDLESALNYAKLNCIACAVGICLLNQDNQEFALVNNLKKVKIIFKNYPEWKDNIYIKTSMPQENKDILMWFEGLKI